MIHATPALTAKRKEMIVSASRCTQESKMTLKLHEELWKMKVKNDVFKCDWGI
jgi:hypothetical protein